MWIPLRRSSEGHEYHWGYNHLAHFAMTQLLMPLLLRYQDLDYLLCFYILYISHSAAYLLQANKIIENYFDFNFDVIF
jgi:hypothetical protein